MFKSIILTVLITVLLTCSLGYLATEWLDLHISLTGHGDESIPMILVFTGMVTFIVVVGLIITFSIFVMIVFTLLATCIGLFFAGLSVFWPVILPGVVIFLLIRDKQTTAY
jgi:hypothetical protein